MTNWNIDPETPLERLWARWISEIKTEIDESTAALYELHGTAHIVPFFRVVGAITTPACATYQRKRLGVVQKATVKKERSTLRRFLGWAAEQGYVEQATELPPLPRRAIGTRYEKRRRGRATELTPEECRAVIDKLPEWSTSKKTKSFPVRARIIVAYDTALRPSTLDALSVPEHHTRGSATLTLTDEIDKARFGRELPLSQEARQALDAICPDQGPIFSKHDYRDALRKAAEGSCRRRRLISSASTTSGMRG